MGRAQAAFSILALVVVCSLLGGTVGAAIIDEFILADPDDTPTASELSEDVYEVELRQEIEENPEDVDALAALGNYLSQTGRLDEGIESYEKALALDPNNVAIRLDFARDLAGGDKRGDAELQFERVIEARPDDPEAHFALAQLYAVWVPPRTDDAITHYQRVVAIGRDSFLTDRAVEELRSLGITALPVAASPVASPATQETAP